MKFSYRRADPQPTLDMTPDGQFRGPAAAPASVKVLRYAIVAAVLAGSLALAALVLWAALLLIPVAIGAAVIAYAAFRWRVWQMRNSRRGQRDVTRF
jgi:Flp pilus assembly protein TadB